MSYYKLIMDGDIVDVMSDPIWIKMGRNGSPIRCGIKDACGVLSRDADVIFQIDGAVVMPCNYDVVSVADITENEYEELSTILEMDGKVKDETNIIQWPQKPEIVEETNDNLVSVIERKIEIMSAACQVAIETGVDVTLASGEVKHFNLTVEDQVNLLDAQNQIASGAAAALYKAEGEPLSYYTAIDIQAIAQAASTHKTRHRAYLESLSQWIMAAATIIEVGKHYYGEDVPEEHWSEVYKALI